MTIPRRKHYSPATSIPGALRNGHVALLKTLTKDRQPQADPLGTLNDVGSKVKEKLSNVLKSKAPKMAKYRAVSAQLDKYEKQPVAQLFVGTDAQDIVEKRKRVFLHETRKKLLSLAKEVVQVKAKPLNALSDMKVQFAKRKNLKGKEKQILCDWFEDHKLYPYPDDREKAALSVRSGVSVERISNWLINARVRRLDQREKQALKRSHEAFKAQKLSARVVKMILENEGEKKKSKC